MKGVILAAGEGSRLQSSVKFSHKGLVNLGGLKIIERVIFAFHKYSVNDIVIVIGYNNAVLKSHLGSGERYGVKLQYVENINWKNGNGSSLYAAKEAMSGENHFLVSMGDHWYEPEVIGEMLESYIDGNLLCVDKNIQNVLDVEEATKVDIDNSGFIRDIGKGLSQYNAVDCGIFIMTEDIFGALKESFNQGNYSPSDAVKLLSRDVKFLTFDIGEHLWQDIDTGKDLVEAERKVFSSLRGKGSGLVMRHLNRPLSIPITKAIANSRLAPNQITVVSFFLCILAGFLFFLGTPLLLVFAGIFVQLSSIIDGVDGELARLKFMSTKYGAYLDSILDRYGDAAIIMGMAYYSYTLVPELWVLLVSLLAVLGTGMSMMSIDAYFRSFGKPYSTIDKDSNSKFLFAGRDGRLFLMFLGGVTNQVLIVLVILAITPNILAVYRLLMVRRVGKSI